MLDMPRYTHISRHRGLDAPLIYLAGVLEQELELEHCSLTLLAVVWIVRRLHCQLS